MFVGELVPGVAGRTSADAFDDEAHLVSHHSRSRAIWWVVFSTMNVRNTHFSSLFDIFSRMSRRVHPCSWRKSTFVLYMYKMILEAIVWTFQ